MAYLEDVRFACEKLIELIANEALTLDEKQQEAESAKGKLATFQQDLTDFDYTDVDFKKTSMRKLHRISDQKKKIGFISSEILSLQDTISAKELAIRALSASLLQIAKQGISVTHKFLDAAPSGRHIGGVSLKEVIWHSRNQALHYEEPHFSKPVTRVFCTLEQAYGSDFSLKLNTGESLAKKVVFLLNWTSYQAFLNDMKSLGV